VCVCVCVCVCVRAEREGGGETGSVCFVWSHGARAAFPLHGSVACWEKLTAERQLTLSAWKISD